MVKMGTTDGSDDGFLRVLGLSNFSTGALPSWPSLSNLYCAAPMILCSPLSPSSGSFSMLGVKKESRLCGVSS